jgi:Skp family chaperone for outer membrane proteins
MRENKVASLLFLFLIQIAASTAIVGAQEAQTAGTKFAFVNTLAILQGTAEGRQELQKIEAFKNEKQQAIQTQSEDLQALRQQYDSQSRMLNPDTAAEMEREIANKDRQLRRLQEDAEVDLNRRQSELLTLMSEKIQTLIGEYAEENGIGVVFLQNPSLPYFSPSLDITAEIIKIYDEKNPVAGAQPAAPAPATP